MDPDATEVSLLFLTGLELILGGIFTLLSKRGDVFRDIISSSEPL
tara:strand:- start:982 stop:1116 length:135 start_codon:yes stop_codon:yes gene_type:complete